MVHQSNGIWMRMRQFSFDEAGFSAAETALLALVLCAMCIMVANIIGPAAVKAAKTLNRELAGIASK